MLTRAATASREVSGTTPAKRARAAAALRRFGSFRLWFRAFRRTRPFWGGVWLIAGGWTVLKFSLDSVQLIVNTGFSGIAGYLTGGGMILCGLIPLALPAQRYTFGLIGAVLAVVSLVVSNLGGFLAGMLLGVIGGSMMVGWGPKKTRPAGRRGLLRRRRARGRATLSPTAAEGSR